MKRLFASFAAVAATLALFGCSGSARASGTSTGGSDHNAADVTFAQCMIAHHRQAIEMADLAAARASSPQVKQLAVRIKKAQRSEIAAMTGWLDSWHEPTTVPTAHPMGGMAMGGASTMPLRTGMPMRGAMCGMPMATASPSPSGRSIPGIMSGEDMAKLAAAPGGDFDRMFLTMMIAHHRGAVTMATAEERDGRYPPAQRLATTIRTSQTAEIGEMNSLLATPASRRSR
jgi:uncharacterized protein (DUF305 family)